MSDLPVVEAVPPPITSRASLVEELRWLLRIAVAFGLFQFGSPTTATNPPAAESWSHSEQRVWHEVMSQRFDTLLARLDAIVAALR